MRGEEIAILFTFSAHPDSKIKKRLDGKSE
jgi:hypothetical protein